MMNKASARQGLDGWLSGFTMRVSLFYGAVFLLIGFHLPYFPVWLEWRGLSPGEIGIVLAAPLVVRVVSTPVISFAADRRGDRRLAIILLARPPQRKRKGANFSATQQTNRRYQFSKPKSSTLSGCQPCLNPQSGHTEQR